MKCSKCGTEFSEGIFCPECGTKNVTEEMLKKEAEKTLESERILQEKLEAERAEAEQKMREKFEAEQAEVEQKMREKFEAEQAEAEQKMREKLEIEQANSEKSVSLRTVRGVVYKTIDEAELAKREHAMIDNLKNQLLTIKSQKKRQKKFSEFKTEMKTFDAKSRYELLKGKMIQKQPLSEKANAIYGWTVFVASIAWIVIAIVEENVDTSTWFYVMFFWSFLGVIIWSVWKIVLFIKSKGKNYYKNIKKI